MDRESAYSMDTALAASRAISQVQLAIARGEEPEPAAWEHALATAPSEEVRRELEEDPGRDDLWEECQAELKRRLRGTESGVPAPSRLALLVGVDQWVGAPAARPLQGAVQDVERAAELFVDRFGFARDDVRVLADEQATHEAVVRAFREHLIGRAGGDTEVVFWYSGPGSRVPDASGSPSAEVDGMDSSFVLYDSRAGGSAGEYDFTDDELGSLLFALSSHTSRVLVVLDTSHAEGALRGGADSARSRTVPDGERSLDPARLGDFWPADVPLVEDNPWRFLNPDRFSCFAAAEQGRAAHEVEFPDAGNHGLMSYFLLEELRRCTPDMTLRELAAQVSFRAGSWGLSQAITAKGAVDRMLFQGEYKATPRGFRAEPVDGGLRVHAGRVHVLRRGAELRVLDGPDGEPVGTARVVEAEWSRSLAEWTEGPAPGAAERALWVVETRRPPATEPLPVYAEDELLARALAGLDEAAPRASPAGSPYRLEFTEDGESAILRDPEGVPVWPSAKDPWGAADAVKRARARGDVGTLGRALADGLRDELRWQELFRLPLEAAELPLALGIRAPTEEDRSLSWGRLKEAPEALFEPDSPGGLAVISERVLRVEPEVSHRFIVELENRADEPVYVYLLDVSEDRSVAQLIPLEGQESFQLEPGEVRAFPAGIFRKAAWPLERPPRDRLIAISSRTKLNLEPLISPTTVRGDGRGEPLLPDVLRRVADTGLSRGGGESYAVEATGWGCAALDVLVELK